MIRYLLATIPIALSSCAVPVGDESYLRLWEGAREVELLRSWGPPSHSYEAQGRKFLVYESRRNLHVPGTAPSLIGGTSTMDIELSCTTTFELENLVVVSWSSSGNDCRSRSGASFRAR